MITPLKRKFPTTDLIGRQKKKVRFTLAMIDLCFEHKTCRWFHFARYSLIEITSATLEINMLTMDQTL